jgi:branched-chain amino acid transport system substrate-binding protein
MKKIILIMLITSALLLAACSSPTGKVTSKEEIKIGYIGPLTGDVSNFGQQSLKAVEQAAEEINSKGGINGKTVKIIAEDGKCDGKEASNAANKLVNIEKVEAIIGGLCSGETLGAAPIAEENKVVMISFASSNPAITNSGEYIFRIYPSDDYQGKFAAEYVYNKLGKRKVAIISCKADWCIGLADNFENNFKKLGGEILIREEVEKGSTDMKTSILKIKEKNPELIYLTSFTQGAVTGIKQIREAEIKVPILGGDAWGDETIPQSLGKISNGVLHTTPKPVDEKIMESKGLQGAFAAQAYDTTYLLKETMTKAKTTDSTKVKEQLYKTKYDGLTGIIEFDQNGDLKQAEYNIMVYKDGEIKNQE